MQYGQVIAVVVPAYQEENNIETTLRTMPELVDHIVVVDDASTDATAAKARAVGDSRIQVLVHDQNGGVGAAVITGHRQALALGADISVVMAGDAQMDPAYLPELLQPVTLGGYGFAKANRFFSATSYKGMPVWRVFGSIALTFLNKASSGYWNLVDPQNGYTAIRADVLTRLDLDAISKRFDFENDLLNWLNILDVPATDVNIPAVYGDEVSTMHLWRDGWRIFWRLTVGFWRRMWRKYILWSFSPVALFLLAGMFLLALTIPAGLQALSEYTPAVPMATATVLLLVLPAMTGFYLLVQALMLDIAATPKPALLSAPAVVAALEDRTTDDRSPRDPAPDHGPKPTPADCETPVSTDPQVGADSEADPNTQTGVRSPDTTTPR